MKSTIIASIAALAMLSGCGSSNGDGGWSDLFNKDLSNAEYEQGVWSRNADGDLQANKDSIIFSKASPKSSASMFPFHYFSLFLSIGSLRK